VTTPLRDCIEDHTDPFDLHFSRDKSALGVGTEEIAVRDALGLWVQSSRRSSALELGSSYRIEVECVCELVEGEAPRLSVDAAFKVTDTAGTELRPFG
jgi:hypothetical protein